MPRQLGDHAIILAIDSPVPAVALRLEKSVFPMVDGIKLGVPTLLSNGASFALRLKENFGGVIIADLKVGDIGLKREDKWVGTNKEIVQTAIANGVDYVICHAIVGTASLQESVDSAHAVGGRVLVLPYMTHEGAGLFFDMPVEMAHAKGTLKALGLDSVSEAAAALAGLKKEGIWRSRRVTVSDLIVLLGEKVGADGYIGPATKPDVLMDMRKLTRKMVVCPGVGRQGGTIRDVFTALGENSAAIVGHSVVDAADPVAACKAYIDERASVLGAKK